MMGCRDGVQTAARRLSSQSTLPRWEYGGKMTSLVDPNDFLQVKESDYDLVIAKYNMTDKMVRESIESINQWYKMQPHLPEGAFSEPRLFRLLLSTGFSMEKVKQKIDNLLTARNIVPELLADRDPYSERIKAVNKYVQWGIIGQRLDDMCRVVVGTCKSEDLTNLCLWDVIRMALMSYDYRISSDVVMGDHYVLDLKNIKVAHTAQITPTMVKKSFFILQGCFGAKIKGIHFVNVPIYAEFVITLFRITLKKKIASRIHVHKDNESLHKLIPRSILPSDLGGDNKDNTQLADDLYEQLATPKIREWFLEQDQLKSDESKRISAASDMSNELQGLQGSFRTLDID